MPSRGREQIDQNHGLNDRARIAIEMRALIEGITQGASERDDPNFEDTTNNRRGAIRMLRGLDREKLQAFMLEHELRNVSGLFRPLVVAILKEAFPDLRGAIEAQEAELEIQTIDELVAQTPLAEGATLHDIIGKHESQRIRKRVAAIFAKYLIAAHGRKLRPEEVAAVEEIAAKVEDPKVLDAVVPFIAQDTKIFSALIQNKGLRSGHIVSVIDRAVKALESHPEWIGLLIQMTTHRPEIIFPDSFILGRLLHHSSLGEPVKAIARQMLEPPLWSPEPTKRMVQKAILRHSKQLGIDPNTFNPTEPKVNLPFREKRAERTEASQPLSRRNQARVASSPIKVEELGPEETLQAQQQRLRSLLGTDPPGTRRGVIGHHDEKRKIREERRNNQPISPSEERRIKDLTKDRSAVPEITRRERRRLAARQRATEWFKEK